MIKSELKYNPYLLETEVTFNGQPPRVNSLVEKYLDGSLHTWIERIPAIFHDEMNGYDFKLEFSGTKRDYIGLQKSFKAAGVSEEQVQLVHKTQLEDRSVKTSQIDALMKWLDANRNRRFQFERFAAKHKELFEGAYNFIVVQGPLLEGKVDGLDISAENIDSIAELSHTDLTGTAILLYVQSDHLASFQGNLKALLCRDDVMQEQLFFLIHAELKRENIQRIIQDLGVRNPQIITSIDEDCVRSYMELYPVSDFIRSTICVFEEETQSLSALLAEENHKSSIANHAIHARIDALDGKIQKINGAIKFFENHKEPEFPIDWWPARTTLEDSIANWKNRKTKMSGEHEAILSAQEFDADLNVFFADFIQELKELASEYEGTTESRFARWYQSSEFGVPDEAYSVMLQAPVTVSIPHLSYNLLRIKHEQRVQPKDDLWGRLFQKQISEPTEETIENVYYYQEWRDYAIKEIMPLADTLMENWESQFRQYENTLMNLYTESLQRLLEQKTAEKNEVSAQLSEDEQLLQEDNDWLAEFCVQLQMIERG